MDYVKTFGVVFLAVYLILTGVGVTLPVAGHDVVHFFAVVAGVLLLISLRSCVSCHDNK